MSDEAKRPQVDRLAEGLETLIRRIYEAIPPIPAEVRKGAREILERGLEALRKQAADALQRGDVVRAEKIEKDIARIERDMRDEAGAK